MKITKSNGEIIECTAEEYRIINDLTKPKVMIASTPTSHTMLIDEFKDLYPTSVKQNASVTNIKTRKPRRRKNQYSHKHWSTNELRSLRKLKNQLWRSIGKNVRKLIRRKNEKTNKTTKKGFSLGEVLES